MDEYYTTRQIAKMLGLKTITIRRWIARGELRAYDLGREYRIAKKDLEGFLDKKKVNK